MGQSRKLGWPGIIRQAILLKVFAGHGFYAWNQKKLLISCLNLYAVILGNCWLNYWLVYFSTSWGTARFGYLGCGSFADLSFTLCLWTLSYDYSLNPVSFLLLISDYYMKQSICVFWWRSRTLILQVRTTSFSCCYSHKYLMPCVVYIYIRSNSRRMWLFYSNSGL